MNHQPIPHKTSGTSDLARQNIIANQLAASLPHLLDKSLQTLESMLESYDRDTRLRAAALIVKTATAIASLKR